MSAPSTPRTTRSVSAAADSPDVLTPGRKIKAMLAVFDSDSDSDGPRSNTPKSNASLANALRNNSNSAQIHGHSGNEDENDDEDDNDIYVPKGRMAARLQAQTENNNTEAPRHATSTETAFDRVSKTLRTEREGTADSRHDSEPDQAMSSDDDLPAAGPRRRLKNAKADGNVNDKPTRSPSRARSFSPLFMSSPARQQNSDFEKNETRASDKEEGGPKRNNRFLALVAQKRKEREEKEKMEAEKRAARAKEQEKFNSDIVADDESEEDGGSGRKLTQQSRPAARKASKKALEEMNRETQRMSRNMQLTHKAQTKKKITKESFFARFNFMQPEEGTSSAQPGENSSTTADSQHSSDAEVQKTKETPHTSPIMGPVEKPETNATNEFKELDLDFPTLEGILAEKRPDVDQVLVRKMAATPANNGLSPITSKKEKKVLTMRPVRVRLSRQQVAQHQKDDSDSDLEVITSPAKCRRIAAFENLTGKKDQESASMFKLKALANLTSPTRKSTMTSAELAAILIYKAKQQAAEERKERIAELRAKGIVVETAAERAALEDEVENLVEKARQEGEEIAKKERKAAKGEHTGDLDDEGDSDYAFSGSEPEEGDDGEGEAEDASDENEDDGDDDEISEEEAGAEKGQDMFDSEAEEDPESEEEQTSAPVLDEGPIPTQRRRRPARVISDDEDEDPAPKTPARPINPLLNSVERPLIPVNPSDDVTMSLTQAFAGTIAGSPGGSQRDASTILPSLPDPLPMSIHEVSNSQIVVKDSQEQRAASIDAFVAYSQSEIRISESPAPRGMSQIPDPTQDAGFVLSPFDPSKRFMGTPPASTIETVLVEQNNSPVAARKLKNLRRGKAADLSAIEEEQEEEENGFEVDASAFNVMKKAAKKRAQLAAAFDRKASKAKDVVEEAAEESDDEYAGLGGGSDDEASDEENAYDREMINDSSGEKVDAKQLAALNALHQRNADEKEVAKLLKDITTGALRRRRGPDDEFDLDDSDDELLARRRQKQREFARMRNALLADGKVGEIAENPKKAAFFKAIEDRDDNDDVGFDFLDYEQGTQGEQSSQDRGSGTQPNATTTEESNKRKRPLEPAAEDVQNRPPPHLRRRPASAMSKKPATLAEIRETVSFLTERPDYDSFREDASMNDEEEEGDHHAEDYEDEPSVTSRPREEPVSKNHPRRTRGPVVDRLALLRQASSNSATSASSNTRFAFHTGGGTDGAAPVGFRPPLLRRTTTSSTSSSSTTASDSSRGVTKASSASLTKKGAVNYYTAARERERERELRTQHRNRGSNITTLLNKHASNRLGALGGTGQWD